MVRRKSLNIILFCLIGCLLISSQVQGQEILYRIFYFTGNIQYKPVGEQQWKPLNALNITLKEGDSLMITGEGKLHLMDAQKKQACLEHPGKYEVTSVKDKATNKTASDLLTQYIEFVWDELRKPHKDLEDYADRYLKEKGGVSRAVTVPIVITPFYDTYIFDDYIDFTWYDSGTEEYVVSFWDSDHNGRRLHAVTSTDTTCSIHHGENWIPEDGSFYWTVTEKGKPTVTFFPIRFLNGEEMISIEEEYMEIDRSLRYISDDLYWLIVASFYEDHNLLVKANDAYLRALESDPGNKVIQEYYNFFLARRGQIPSLKY